MPFAALAENIKKIDTRRILRDVMTEENIQAWIKETVTGRLKDDGITGSLKRLRTDRSFEQGTSAYSLFTTALKGKEGHVDLFDSGSLHRSFKITLKEWGWSQTMNFLNPRYKTDIYLNFTRMYSSPEEFENDVESMTEDELSELITTKIIPSYIRRFYEIL